MIYLEYAPAATLCLIGLALAVALRRRLGRAAWLAISAFVLLALAHVGSLVWFEYRSDALDRQLTNEELWDLLRLWDRLRWGLATVTAAGFALVLGAVLAGPRRPRAAAVDSPSAGATVTQRK